MTRLGVRAVPPYWHGEAYLSAGPQFRPIIGIRSCLLRLLNGTLASSCVSQDLLSGIPCHQKSPRVLRVRSATCVVGSEGAGEGTV